MKTENAGLSREDNRRLSLKRLLSKLRNMSPTERARELRERASDCIDVETVRRARIIAANRGQKPVPWEDFKQNLEAEEEK